MQSKQRKKIAVFGTKDTFCGQIVQTQQFKEMYIIEKMLTEEIEEIDESELHARNPVKTCEYIRNRRIFGAEVLEGEEAWEYLEQNTEKEDRIYGLLILEDNNKRRQKIISKVKEYYREKIKILSWISETATLKNGSRIGEGVVIMDHCYVGYKTEIGDSVTIQTGSIIEHHSKIGKFVNICPGFLSGSFIEIEEMVQINIGVTTFNRIKVSKEICIAAGSLVTKNCDKPGIYLGRPAAIWNPGN